MITVAVVPPSPFDVAFGTLAASLSGSSHVTLSVKGAQELLDDLIPLVTDERQLRRLRPLAKQLGQSEKLHPIEERFGSPPNNEPSFPHQFL